MVFDDVKRLLCEQLDLDEDKVTPEASIVDDLGADSIDVIDLVTSLEDMFDIEIPDEEIENIKLVSDLVDFIESKQ